MNYRKVYHKQYYVKNRKKILEKQRIYREKNKEKKNEYAKKYYQLNKRKRQKYFSLYWKSEKGKINSKRKYLKRQISHCISTAINRCLKHNKNGHHWEDLVDYTLEELKQHLESLFQEGMTWNNHGRWHIDHIRPISSFNLTDNKCEDFKECWTLENLQPLWAEDNIRKGNKI